MMPVGPLMVEHRLIERMILLMAEEARRIRSTGKVNADFVLSAVDFIRTYADRCHHGKEEEILFRDLKLKPLSAEHRALLEELEAEHKLGRKIVRQLTVTRELFLKGDRASAPELARLMEQLAGFYPRHIEKEDHSFFEACMDYFTPEERDRMLEECREFDRTLVHTTYESLVRGLEGKPQAEAPAGAGAQGPAADKHVCMLCGYTYDPRVGDPVNHIPAGVPFQELPEDWVCPHCHASRTAFIPSGR